MTIALGQERSRCTYGENPWQSPAAYYSFDTDDPLAVDRFEAIAGTDPSYNIITDIERNLQTVTHIAAAFEANHCGKRHITVATKHGEPCGASYSFGDDPTPSLIRAIHGSLEEIHGGTILCTYPVHGELAEVMLRCLLSEDAQRRLIDCVFAPSFTDEAVAVLKRPGENKCRLFANPALASLGVQSIDTGRRFRYVRGGVLVQPNYTEIIDLPEVVTYRRGERVITAIEDNVARDLLLAWAVCASTKSNAITLAKEGKIIANGAGQRSSKRCVKLALWSAAEDGHDVRDAVMASDAFFPFEDAPCLAIEAGVKHILTCSGAIRDKEIIALTAKYDFTLFMTKNRSFFGH